MRQRHAAGERMFVDYFGKRMAVIDPATGMPVRIFRGEPTGWEMI